MANNLDRSPMAIIGLLHCFWWWAIDNAQLGDLSNFTPRIIEDGCGWTDYCQRKGLTNQEGQFVRQLFFCGFIERGDLSDKRGDLFPTRGDLSPHLVNFDVATPLQGGARIHDWMVFCGDLMRKRIERQQKMKSRSRRISGRFVPPTVPYRSKDSSYEESMLQPPEALALSEKLKTLILANNPKAKVPDKLEPWAKEVTRMMRLDKRTQEEIIAVMEFSQHDGFWRMNILSMRKLRDKFDQLWMKMNSGGSNGQNKNHIAGYAAPTPGKFAKAIESHKSDSE